MDKTNAYNHMMAVFAHSWTWEKMTTDEQERFRLMSIRPTVRGTFAQRCEQYNNIYAAFLAGLGYTGPGWREEV